MKKNILIINGSPQGKKGNCAALILKIKKEYKNYKIKTLHLAQEKNLKEQLGLMEAADGLLITTGTYWDSWGSPLQEWLEKITPYEGSPLFMGKPVGVVVLMHSVGGKGVLSRLQGVMNTLGCVTPPMSGMVYSLVSDLAKKTKSSHSEDFWSLEDIEVILKNMEFYMGQSQAITAWPVDKKNPARRWLK